MRWSAIVSRSSCSVGPAASAEPPLESGAASTSRSSPPHIPAAPLASEMCRQLSPLAAADTAKPHSRGSTLPRSVPARSAVVHDIGCTRSVAPTTARTSPPAVYSLHSLRHRLVPVASSSEMCSSARLVPAGKRMRTSTSVSVSVTSSILRWWQCARGGRQRGGGHNFSPGKTCRKSGRNERDARDRPLGSWHR